MIGHLHQNLPSYTSRVSNSGLTYWVDNQRCDCGQLVWSLLFQALKKNLDMLNLLISVQSRAKVGSPFYNSICVA